MRHSSPARVAVSRGLHHVRGGAMLKRRPLTEVGVTRMKWSFCPVSHGKSNSPTLSSSSSVRSKC